MKYRSTGLIIFIIATIWLCAGCPEDTPVPAQGENYYPFEIEPILSTDRQYVYFSLRDTAAPSLTGIYRARVVRPEREPIWLDSGLTSPSPSANLQQIAALRYDTLLVYTVSDSSVLVPALGSTFESVCFVGNNTIITVNDSTISRYSLSGGGLQFDRYGYDPVAFSDSSYTCLVRTGDFNWAVIEAGLNGATDTLYQVASTFPPRWPLLNANRDRLVLARQATAGYELWGYNLTTSTDLLLAESDYPKACLIGNYLLFTGAKPILNQVSLFGGSISLWVFAEPIESAPSGP